MERRKFLWMAVTAAAGTGTAVVAQPAYPDRPIKLLIPFAPGGGTDTAARLVMKKVEDQIGQAIIVENKPGGGGVIAYGELLRSRADGYTLTIGSGSRATMNLFNDKVPFNAANDLVAVVPLANVPIALVASNALPVKNTAEFIAYARANPRLSFGSPGPGTPNHLAGVLLASTIGAELVHVGYKGTSPALQDVMGDHLPLAVVGLSSAMQYVGSGKLKVLGVGSAKRSALAPDIPTLAEGGAKGFDASYWYDITVAAGTPKAVIDRLHAEVNKAVAHPEVRAAFDKQGFEPMVMSRADYLRLLKVEDEKWTRVIKANNIRVE
jgi:tripartite-type tricarboxylate transporter receptor subunit TctC